MTVKQLIELLSKENPQMDVHLDVTAFRDTEDEQRLVFHATGVRAQGDHNAIAIDGGFEV